MSQSSSPIADLSYRHYDGPLNAPVARWWSIAKMTIQVAIKKKAFWGWSIVSSWWYLILLAVFWFMDNVAGTFGAPAEGGKNPFLSQIIWKDQFVHGFSYSQMILMVVALLVGAGSIANDNRKNPSVDAPYEVPGIIETSFLSKRVITNFFVSLILSRRSMKI